MLITIFINKNFVKTFSTSKDNIIHVNFFPSSLLYLQNIFNMPVSNFNLFI